jgi:hypothetical protein
MWHASEMLLMLQVLCEVECELINVFVYFVAVLSVQ